MNFSKKYYDTLLKSINFHNKSVNWSGDGSYQYVEPLKSIINQYECRTMLDYGCGKGDQYTDDPLTDFSKLIGVDSYSLYDPAYEKYNILQEGIWDIAICLDVLPFIPEEDIPTVKELLLSRSNKKVVIGLQKSVTVQSYKSKKPYVSIKSTEWWESILKDENLIIIWLDPEKPFDRQEFLKSCVL